MMKHKISMSQMANFGKEEGSWSAVKLPGHTKSHHMMLTHTWVARQTYFHVTNSGQHHLQSVIRKQSERNGHFESQSEKIWHFAGGQMDNQAEFLSYESISLHVLQYLCFFTVNSNGIQYANYLVFKVEKTSPIQK